MYPYPGERVWSTSWARVQPHVPKSPKVKIFLILAGAVFFFSICCTFNMGNLRAGVTSSMAGMISSHHGDSASPNYTIATINLLDVPCYILTPNKSRPAAFQKADKMRKSLLHDGFNEVYVVEGVDKPDHKIYAVAFGHGMLLQQALRHKPFRPFLLFEDDATHEAGFDPILEYPADADGVYLSVDRAGAAISGTKGYGHWNQGVVYSRHADLPNMARVYNMLSTHAVLILSERFALNWQRAVVEGCSRDKHFDVFVAFTQRYYNTYAQRLPLFWQSAKESQMRWELQGMEIHGVQDIPLQDDRPASVTQEIAAFDVGGQKDVDFAAETEAYAHFWRQHHTDEDRVGKAATPYREKYREQINHGVPKYGKDRNIKEKQKPKDPSREKAHSFKGSGNRGGAA